MTSGATTSVAWGGCGRRATAGADMWARGVGGRRRERWADAACCEAELRCGVDSWSEGGSGPSGRRAEPARREENGHRRRV